MSVSILNLRVFVQYPFYMHGEEGFMSPQGPWHTFLRTMVCSSGSTVGSGNSAEIASLSREFDGKLSKDYFIN